MGKDATSGQTSETQDAQDPQTGTVTTPPGTGETPGTKQPQLSIEDALKEIESLKTALKKTNSESAGHRLKAKELDELKAQIEAEKLSETEKLQKKISDLQSQHDTLTRQQQERIVSYEVRLQAASMGVVDPDAAARLLDWSEIDYDDNGSPTNVEDLLKKLLKSKPYLAGKQSASSTSGGATNPPRSQSTAPQALSHEVIAKMTREEYLARRAEIDKWRENNSTNFRARH